MLQQLNLSVLDHSVQIWRVLCSAAADHQLRVAVLTVVAVVQVHGRVQ